MTKRNRWGWIAAVSIIALAAGCAGNEGEKTVAAVDEAIPVRTAVVARRMLTRSLVFSGSMEPWKEAALGAQMPGRIQKIFVEEGDRVVAGDLLVQMGDEQLTQAEAQFVGVQKDWERMRTLLQKGTVSTQMFDQIDARYKAAKASRDLVRESTRLRAPFPGVVAEKLMNEGEVFTLFPSSESAPAILKLMQVDRLKVRVNMH